MSKYGYIGKESDIPQQAFQSNTGVLSVNVVADPSPVIVWVDMDLN